MAQNHDHDALTDNQLKFSMLLYTKKMAQKVGPFQRFFFSRKSDFIFRQIMRNTKKIKHCRKIQNIPTSTYILIFVCRKKNHSQFSPQKSYFPNFSLFLKSLLDAGDGDGDGDCDRHGEFCSPPMKCGPLHIYRDSQKNLGQKSQC